MFQFVVVIFGVANGLVALPVGPQRIQTGALDLSGAPVRRASRGDPGDAAFRYRPPVTPPARPFRVPEADHFQLSSGLPVILLRARVLPVVRLELVVKAGAGEELPDQAGLVALTSRLLSQQAGRRSAVQLVEELDELGADLSVSSTWDSTSVALSTMRDTLPAAAKLWVDVWRYPAFSEDAVDRERELALGAARRRLENPSSMATLLLTRALFGRGHRYGRPAGGDEETLPRLTARDAQTFWQQWCQPKSAVLVVSGDVSPAQVRDLLDPMLAGWREAKVVRRTLAEPRPVPGRVLLVRRPGATQASIRVGTMAMDRASSDHPAFLVMNRILGGAFTRLGMNLRERRGWTYAVNSVFDARRSAGPWMAGGEFAEAHTADAVREILWESRRMGAQPVRDEELAQTKAELLQSFPSRFATPSQAAAQFGTVAAYDLPPRELQAFRDRITAVTKADVRRVARRYLRPEILSVVVVGDEKHAGALRALGEVQVVDAADAFASQR
jgi:zinc protease